MRKVFWCCSAAALVAAGSVYLAAKHIDRHPGDVIASLMGGAATPGSCPAVPGGEPVPAEPTPAESSSQTVVPLPCSQEVVASTDEKLGNEIAVDEGTLPMPRRCKESVVGEEMPEASTATIDPGSLPGDASMAPMTPCPNVMPYCPDDEASRRRMPYADEEQCEEPADSASAGLEMAGQAISAGVEAALESIMPATEGEEMPPYKCPEDEYHRQHSEYCPYTGRCYPQSYVPSPAVPDPEEKQPEGANKTEDPAPKMKSSSEEQEMPPPLTDLDTMEFRPSDAGLQRFIPGPL